MRKPGRYWLALLTGSAIAFLADYPPARDAIERQLRAIADELRARRQYDQAIRQTLDSIRRLPETEPGE